jgi:SOS-response transcriptional repressor LexA
LKLNYPNGELMSTENFTRGNNISERVARARGAAGLNQREAAKVLGISAVTMNRYEKGGRVPETEIAVDMARKFQVSLTWLLTGEGPMLEQTAPPLQIEQNVTTYHDYRPSKRVPVISWIQAGGWGSVEDPFHPGDADDWLETTATTHENAFALTVFGDSMTPEFGDGDIIVVDPGKQAVNGSYIVAKNGDLATFKQLVYDGSSVFLKPLNDRYPIRDMTGIEFRIVGVVVEKRKRY